MLWHVFIKEVCWYVTFTNLISVTKFQYPSGSNRVWRDEIVQFWRVRGSRSLLIISVMSFLRINHGYSFYTALIASNLPQNTNSSWMRISPLSAAKHSWRHKGAQVCRESNSPMCVWRWREGSHLTITKLWARWGENEMEMLWHINSNMTCTEDEWRTGCVHHR